ncbi:uncharacterized protein B0H18DRAFT_1012704, partial [Fomitopsis serialis]|uniref:uncharacterized protein n=1 Tax=Fomitopsis serialis TaxID=139415 RepID=UPI00200810E7
VCVASSGVRSIRQLCLWPGICPHARCCRAYRRPLVHPTQCLRPLTCVPALPPVCLPTHAFVGRVCALGVCPAHSRFACMWCWPCALCPLVCPRTRLPAHGHLWGNGRGGWQSVREDRNGDEGRSYCPC